jgi:hypothetical protein
VNVIKNHLAGSANDPAVVELARAFGTDANATRDALATVMDEISRRMEQLTLSRGGLADLVRALGDSHHEAYLKDPRLIGSPAMENDGRAILDHVFWTKDRSRGVAARAARDSALPAATIEKMLPSMAALAMGELTRAAAGPFDDILRRIPGLGDALDQMRQQGRGGAPARPDRSREVITPRDTQDTPPTEFGTPNERMPGGGSKQIPEQRPLPVPGDDTFTQDRAGSRYDDLSDILRRGGFKFPRGNDGGERDPQDLPDSAGRGSGEAAGGTLYNIIRAVLGALLGFQSRGLIGWLVRLIVLRWGWGFVQRIVGRILGRVLVGR